MPKKWLTVNRTRKKPFEETDLVSIRNHKVISSFEAVKCVTEAFTVRLKQYVDYVVSRTDQIQNAINEFNPRTNIHIFHTITRNKIRQIPKLLICVKIPTYSAGCI